MVAAYQIKAVVSEDRKLIIELPEDFPAGEVQVQVESVPTPAAGIENQTGDETPPVTMTREMAMERLRAAGRLATGFEVPEGTVLLSPEEILKLGTLPPGSPSSLDLINEDRGER